MVIVLKAMLSEAIVGTSTVLYEKMLPLVLSVILSEPVCQLFRLNSVFY